MFGWLRKRRAYKLGQQGAQEITAEIEAYIAGRVVPAGERFMSVFSDCLANVFNDPEVNPRDKASVEWESFAENLQEFAENMRAEINVESYKWDEMIEVGGRELLDEYISKRIGEIVSEMRLKAAELTRPILAEIERREALPTTSE